MLLDELVSLGLRLEREGEVIFAEVDAGVDIAPHIDHIKACKPALLAALGLRERIIQAVTVAPEHFNRAEYDRLWVRWHAQEAKEEATP
jgi:hypothetical protein